MEIMQELQNWITEVRILFESFAMSEGVTIPAMPENVSNFLLTDGENTVKLPIWEMPFSEYSLTEGMLLLTFVMVSVGVLYMMIRGTMDA